MRAIKRPSFAATILPFVTFMAIGLTATGTMAQPKPAPAPAAAEEAPQVEQVALTEKQITALIAGQKDIAGVASKIPESDADKPDPKTIAKLDAVAKKNGFADYSEYDKVATNVNLVLGGFDPEKKTFVGPDVVIKKEIAEIKADKQMPAKDKKQALEEMDASLKAVQPIKFPDNIKLVTKYYDKLAALLQDDQQK